MKTEAQFTITRSTPTGKQEVLTSNGFRSREVVQRDGLEIEYYNKVAAWALVDQLRKDCRIKQIARSITVNYS